MRHVFCFFVLRFPPWLWGVGGDEMLYEVGSVDGAGSGGDGEVVGGLQAYSTAGWMGMDRNRAGKRMSVHDSCVHNTN